LLGESYRVALIFMEFTRGAWKLNPRIPPSFVRALILSWITAVAIYFLLNAGVFASFFASKQSFLLTPTEAFVRIPVGYGSILLLTLVLTVLIYRGKEARPYEGMRAGLLYGTAVSLTTVLGLWSITTIPTTFLGIWLVDQILEMMLAGTVIALVRFGASRRITSFIVIGVLACFIIGLALQNLPA